MKLLDIENSFYAPLWRRIGILAVLVGWGSVELANGALGWAAFCAGLTVYCAYQFFVVFKPREQNDNQRKL